MILKYIIGFMTLQIQTFQRKNQRFNEGTKKLEIKTK